MKRHVAAGWGGVRDGADQVGAAAADQVAVDDVVVEDEGVVEELHGGGGVDDGLGSRAIILRECRVDREDEAGAHELPAEHRLGGDAPQLRELGAVTGGGVGALGTVGADGVMDLVEADVRSSFGGDAHERTAKDSLSCASCSTDHGLRS